MKHAETVILKRWLPILKEYERTRTFRIVDFVELLSKKKVAAAWTNQVTLWKNCTD